MKIDYDSETNHNWQRLAYSWSSSDDVVTKNVQCQSYYDLCSNNQPPENVIRSCVKKTIAQGDYAVAIALIDELISMRPDSALDYNNRGLLYYRNNQLEKAVEDLTRALEINPNLDSAYNNRANCYAAQGDLISAISDYDTALDLNPTNVRAWINQGITFRELGSYDLGIDNFDIALIINDEIEERIYAERGRAYHLRGDWNCAVADYQMALKILKNKGNSLRYQKKVQNWLDELIYPISKDGFSY